MQFPSIKLPDIDLDEWRSRSHHRRLEPLAKDWALNGFGTPALIYIVYLVKIALYAVGAVVVISATSNVGGIGDFGDWWTQPITYQKLVVWTLLWEILGLGCGSFPLTLRFIPPIGGVLYWVQPETMRLPPWPGKVPFTRGTRRTLVDVALYLAVLGDCVVLLCSGATHGYPFDTLPTAPIVVLQVVLGALGLRDKTAFLAARPEHYLVMMVVFLFPPTNMVFALKLCMLALWWGAATSKLNRHFPFVVSVMVSNTPWQKSSTVKKALYRDYPADMRPSRLSELLAHGGTVVEFTVPLILILSRGGWLTTAAVIAMVLFHLHIFSTFPLGVPLEWNVFFIFSILYLFGHYDYVGAGSLTSTVLTALLVLLLAVGPVLGNLRPDLVSFLPAMRYYAGNWASSLWLFRKDGSEDRLDNTLVKPARIPFRQLADLYDEQTADLLLYRGLAFRGMHSHGRALNGLLTRAVDDLGQYDVRDGELVAGVALGWNFGDGHLHDHRLLNAIQRECEFEPGQLRVITLESQPIHRPTQLYRILDAAEGLLEEGTVLVADMVSRQPWLSADDVTIPVEVSFRATASAPTVFAPTPVAEAVVARPRPRPRPTAQDGPRPRPLPRKPVA
ncbi:MAG: hypothetical protein QOI35_3169 [Cryptosporangiaceae bacterium]|nr:hypothetical protein [Cryptosporangiaceae bacterium]